MTVPSTPEEPELEPLPRWLRIVLLIAGIFFLVLGVLGLALPFLQGILFLVIAVALLSLASEGFYQTLTRLLSRWPGVLARVTRFRQRLHSRLVRSAPPKSSDD